LKGENGKEGCFLIQAAGFNTSSGFSTAASFKEAGTKQEKGKRSFHLIVFIYPTTFPPVVC